MTTYDQKNLQLVINKKLAGVAILSFASLVYICENEIRDRVIMN